MMHNPSTAKGALSWAIFGFSAAVVALLVGSLFPSIIPTGATKVRL